MPTSVTPEGYAYALGLRETQPDGYARRSVHEQTGVIQSLSEDDQDNINSAFLARYLPALIAKFTAEPLRPPPKQPLDSVIALTLAINNEYWTLFRRRDPTAYEDLVQHAVTSLATLGPDVTGCERMAFEYAQLTTYLVMFSDQDPRKTLRNVDQARAAVSAWGRKWGSMRFHDGETMEIFSRLDGQLPGHPIWLSMSAEVRKHSNNEDKRCSLPGCSKETPKLSRCSRCETAQKDHWPKHKRRCYVVDWDKASKAV